MISYCRRESPISRASQGDIYRDIVMPLAMPLGLGQNGKEFEIAEIEYNYAVVLTQECDLEQDFRNKEQNGDKQDKCLPSILLAPAYLAEQLREGTHLSDLGLVMEHIDSKRWRILIRDNNKRYHFLEKDLEHQVPDLVVDFKHYFTLSRDFFYSKMVNDIQYVASIDVLYREHLSHRFAYYLSRIGLPEE